MSDFINTAIVKINESFDYVRANFMQIGVLLVLIIFLKNKFQQNAGGETLNSSEKSRSFIGSSSSHKNREEEMRRVRLQQQEIMNQRAIEAEKERKEKEAEKKLQKLQLNKEKKEEKKQNENVVGGTKKKKKDTNSNDMCSYNPMQPWTSNTGGYRAQRRQVRRG